MGNRISTYNISNKFEGLQFWEQGEYSKRYGLYFEPYNICTKEIPLKLCQTTKNTFHALGNRSKPVTDVQGATKHINPNNFALKITKTNKEGNQTDEYRLVPSEFTVNTRTNQVTKISSIEPYLVGEHGDLYKTVADLFGTSIMPLFNKLGILSRTNQITRNLQVVVKAQSFVMEPNSEYEGFWHIEGVNAEHIKGVGICYYEFSDSLKGGELGFRPRHLCYGGHDGHYKLGDDDICVPIKAGTAIAFSNYEVIHRLSKVSNTSSTTARRSYVAFWLIDTEHKVPSTKSLGCRNIMYHASRLHVILCGKIPAEICLKICLFAGLGVSKEEQKETREAIRSNRAQIEEDINKPRNRRGYHEGWQGMDGGIMSFRGILKTVNE